MSRKRSVSGRSNLGMVLRQPCKHFLKGTCTRSPCEYWHPPECQFYKAESGCIAGDKCLFPHHKVDEQPNKKPKQITSPTKEESEDKNAVAVVQIVPQLGCVSPEGYSLGETRCKKSWDHFDECDSLSLHYVKQVSGEIEDHLLEKYKSKFLISEVPTP